MKIIFMGTPAFAVPILDMLIKNHDVLMVVTQPDKPVGRKRKLTPSLIKTFAESMGIDVFQPTRIKKDYQPILDMKADILITAAYGQILPKGLLSGITSLNIHGSLLPAYRGAAPIQYALFDGLKETGITVMEMIYEMDAGPIILQGKISIDPTDNFQTLSNKLSLLGVKLLKEVLSDFNRYFDNRKPQDASKVTFSPLIKYDDETIDFSWPTAKIVNRIRGLAPEPGAHFTYNDNLYKVYHAVKSDIIDSSSKPSTILQTKKRLTIKTRDGAIDIMEIQAHGKKRLHVKDYLNGQTVFHIGERIKEDNDVN